MNYIYTDHPVQAAAQYLAVAIRTHLENNERVVWLLSGGSGVKVGLAVSRLLTGVNLSNLAVTLTDERYGPLGHSNENWQELLDGGLDLPGATLYRPLIGNASREETTTQLSSWLHRELAQADYAIGLFGIGSDGHTAGIKPNSIAIESSEWAAGYVGADFERITMTFVPIRQLDEVVIQATGIDKRTALEELQTKDVSLNIQPVQILKAVPLATIYSDNKIQ